MGCPPESAMITSTCLGGSIPTAVPTSSDQQAPKLSFWKCGTCFPNRIQLQCHLFGKICPTLGFQSLSYSRLLFFFFAYYFCKLFLLYLVDTVSDPFTVSIPVLRNTQLVAWLSRIPPGLSGRLTNYP